MRAPADFTLRTAYSAVGFTALLLACNDPPTAAPAPSASGPIVLGSQTAIATTMLAAPTQAGSAAPVVSASAAAPVVESVTTTPPIGTLPSTTARGAKSAMPLVAAGTAAALVATPPPTAVATAAPSVSAKVPPKFASAGVNGNHFQLGLSAQDDCAVGAECTGSISLTATGGYHINNEYPYKFIGDASGNYDWISSGANSFSKAGGNFAKTSETTAVMSFRYRGKAPGAARLSGTYKMSVCSEANCQIEVQAIGAGITVR
jgi:hypothetical protein